ncbi:MAG: glycosyltransferase family 2 protein [Bacteroidetes bacterium]|nr:glycosyltransferase family 2 protein [Bacteroidota bacterium]MBI3482305.1 glycosyltransferase family 2 protein [Bacteroidota bacterium]
MEKLRASIVVYKTDSVQLRQVMDCFLSSSVTGHLTVIDNSPTDQLRQLCEASGADYVFNGKNLGYGRGHNIALVKSLNKSLYHLVLNPDVYFEQDALEKIFHFMEEHPQAGLAMPKVFSAEGQLQMLCKLLPTPLDLASRRFFPFDGWFKKLNGRYEMRNTGYGHVMNVPFLSGCFMFLRTTAIKQVGVFDERFFLYAEDTDLSRRLHEQFHTLFFPGAEIRHVHARGSYKDFWLTIQNLKSAIQYFNKWGWFFDADRMAINQRAQMQVNVVGAPRMTLSEVKTA